MDAQVPSWMMQSHIICLRWDDWTHSRANWDGVHPCFFSKSLTNTIFEQDFDPSRVINRECTQHEGHVLSYTIQTPAACLKLYVWTYGRENWVRVHPFFRPTHIRPPLLELDFGPSVVVNSVVHKVWGPGLILIDENTFHMSQVIYLHTGKNKLQWRSSLFFPP